VPRMTSTPGFCDVSCFSALDNSLCASGVISALLGVSKVTEEGPGAVVSGEGPPGGVGVFVLPPRPSSLMNSRDG
jgi:hypothetical protein